MKPRKNDPDLALSCLAVYLIANPLAMATHSSFFYVIMWSSGLIVAGHIIYNEWFK